jgi:predicted Zn-dependent protease
MRGAAWVLVLGFWVLGIRRGLGELSRPRRAAAPVQPQLDEWFQQAQTEYLRGHWIEAETLLSKLLVQQPHDAEARLLLASILRRTQRLSASRKALTDLSSDETAARWTWEIQAELARISASEEEQPELRGDSLSRAA